MTRYPIRTPVKPASKAELQMDWQRNILLVAMAAVTFLLVLEWNDFRQAQTPELDQTTTVQPIGELPALPSAKDSAERTVIPEVPVVVPADAPLSEHLASLAAQSGERLVTVRTDVLDVLIDTIGGDILRVALPQHQTSLEEGADSFVLLNQTSATTYVAQSGLIGPQGTDSGTDRPVFRVAQSSFELDEGQDQLIVDLVLEQNGVEIHKQFVFRRGDYLVDVNYQINNDSSEPWQAHLFAQIKRDAHSPAVGNSMGMKPYLGAALSTDDRNYHRISFDDLRKESYQTTRNGGWIAMVQHYFISAWIPQADESNRFSLRQVGEQDLYVLGYTGPAVNIAPGETGELRTRFYAGPKDQYRLQEIAPYLDLTIDYGWLWWLAKPIFWLLIKIQGVVGNWGWSIILLTVAIKTLFFHLSAKSYRSMAAMRKLQPEMMRLRDLHADDRQKLSQATMELYRKHKVNPLGGCLPILVQMPVFISLYWVLSESVELRHAPWILWIQDLSIRDPWFILPIIMGVTMYAQQRLNPAPPDPMQARIMQIMPVAFTFFLMWFPAGLVLYWTVNNLLSILQQWLITRRIEASN